MKGLSIWIASLMVLFTLSSCAPREIVKVDLLSLNENPEEYEDKRVIITTDIENIAKDPEPYFSKDVELSGFVGRDSSKLDWEFLLENEEGSSVRCYESEYRIYPWIRADMAIRKARIKDEKITVVGVFKKGFGIELDWIEYEGQIIDTDYRPYRFSHTFLW